MLLAAACKVDTTVTVTMHDDGSGVVTVTAVLDPDAVKAAESGGGKLEERVRLGDLGAHGWTVQPWARAADGSAQITFTKPGVYHFTTKAGEDYMAGMKTIGEDNVLRLTVVVS